MINTPEGFDARTRCFTKPFSLGMLQKLAIKSSSTQNVSRLNPQKAADSRPPWAQKFSVRAVDTIFKYLSTKGSLSKLVSADPPLLILNKPSQMECTDGRFTMVKPGTIAILPAPTMGQSWPPEISLG